MVSLGASKWTILISQILIHSKTPIPWDLEFSVYPRDGEAVGRAEKRALLLVVNTQELGAGAHGQAVGTVHQLDGFEVIWTLAGESFSSCCDEAEMRTAAIVGTTGITH